MLAKTLARCPLAAVAALGVLLCPPAAAGQAAGAKPSPPARQAPSPAVSPKGEAYYQFMLGRHLEGEGDIEGAIKAYREASRLDPKSAEVVAELAGLYARENKIREAIDRAEAALAVDAANVSAHRLLGLINASMARLDQGTGPFDADAAAYAAKAAEHLDAARRGSDLPEPGLEMMLARLYDRLGQRDKAIDTLNHVVVDDPGQPEPVRLLLQMYQQAGRDADAVALLESVVADQPSFGVQLGDLYGKLQRWNDAARAYERAAGRGNSGPDVRRQQAEALLRVGDPASADRAFSLLEQLHKENPADIRSAFDLSNAQRNAGRLDEAEATAREILAVSPNAVAGTYALALVFEMKQQYQKVIDTLSPVVEKQAGSPAGVPSAFGPLLLQLGLASYQLGDPVQALAYYDRAGKLSPPYPGLDMYVAQAQLAAGNYAEAAALSARLRASDPGNIRVLQLSAESARRTGRPDEGVKLLADALEKSPDDLPLYFYAAAFDVELQRYDGALGVLEKAKARFPSNAEVTFQIGAVLAQQKKFADAEQLFRDVLTKDPRHASALNYLGYMLADRGERLDEAIGYIKRALEIEPYNGAFIDSLGWAYFRQNKLDLAETNLSKAAGQRPRDSAVQDHFGDLLYKLGRYPEAASAWQRALKGDMEQVDRAALEKKLRSAQDKTRKH